jgi:hypothetical protein
MSAVIREATPEDLHELGFEDTIGLESWAGVAIEEGKIVGHIRLSWGLGQCFGHDTACWATDQTAALRMWRLARNKVRELGFDHVVVHLADDDPMVAFWMGRGFEKQFSVYRGEI